jgi:hypothetical protein
MEQIETYKYDDLPESMQVIIQDWAENSIIPKRLKYCLIALSTLPNVPVNKETDSDFDGVRDEVYALKMDLNKVPPIIIANGVLMDGRHRVFSARAKGLKEIHAIDLTGVITERMSRIDGIGPIRY